MLVLVGALAALLLARTGNRRQGALESWLHPVGTPLAFDLPALDDPAGRIDTSALRGLPLIVNVFASTCAPCVEELPRLQQAATAHAGKVRFVGVDFLDRRDAGLALVKRTGVRFPVAFDERGRLATTWRLSGLPGTFFLDREGRLVHQQRGAISTPELDKRIRSLIP